MTDRKDNQPEHVVDLTVEGGGVTMIHRPSPTQTIVAGPIPGLTGSLLPAETHIPLEPPVEEPTVQTASEAGGSPLSLAESHARLEVSAAKLGTLVKDAKTKSDEAMVLYRNLRAELDETTRAIKAMDRIRHPRTRKP